MTTFTVPLSNSRLETDIRRGLCGIRKLNPRNPRLKLFSKQPFIQPLVDIDIDHSTSCTDCSPRQYIRRIMHSLVHTGNSHGTSPQGRRSYHIPVRILHTERGGKGKSRCRMPGRKRRAAFMTICMYSVGIFIIRTFTTH